MEDSMEGCGQSPPGGQRHEREPLRSPDGETFALRLLHDPADPSIDQIHALLLEELSEEEADTLPWIKHAVQEHINRYHVVETAEGRVIALSSTQVLPLPPGEETPEQAPASLLVVWFVVTAPPFRHKGLASALYQRFVQDTIAEAQARGQPLKGIIGEAVSTVEVFLNRMGRKRLYFADETGNLYEVPYLCPPVDFDPHTGEPLALPVPEHLMLSLPSGAQEMRVEDVLQMVAVLYAEYAAQESDYASLEAFRRAQNYTTELLSHLQRALARATDGKVWLLSRAERTAKLAELQGQGKTLYSVKATLDA